ncbi:MAG: PilZ domain-containing protein [Phycisphaerales bacterium]|nr:MAG: PilZ domain-containing protein [Phycisphaerales bacterium]
MTRSHPTEVHCVDLLRMSDDELHELLDNLERPEDTPETLTQREEPRYPYRLPVRLAALISRPDGAADLFSIVPRDLSCNGIGFLHGQFVYPDARVVVKLPTIDQDSVIAVGRVKRCRHVCGRVHEVGIRFEQTFDLKDFLPPGYDAETGQDPD